MDFFGIGFWEFVFILIIGLLLFGPSRLSEIARSLGEAIRRFKTASSQMPKDITKEIDEDMKEEIAEVKDIEKSVRRDISLDTVDSKVSTEEVKAGKEDKITEVMD